jgi:hypothetical protein
MYSGFKTDENIELQNPETLKNGGILLSPFICRFLKNITTK